MFQVISKEAVLANVLLDYIKLQQANHRSALAVLDEAIPGLQSCIGKEINLRNKAMCSSNINIKMN